MRSLFARCRSASFFKRFVSEIAPFSRKTYQSCHCEEGAAFAPDAAIFNETICHPVTNYGCAERNRTLKESGTTQRIHVFCDRDFFLFRAPVLRCGMPYLWLKDCRVAALLAMTRNCSGFVWKTDGFGRMQVFSSRIDVPFLHDPHNDTKLRRFWVKIACFARILTLPLHADGCRLLVFRTLLQSAGVSKSPELPETVGNWGLHFGKNAFIIN